MLPGVNLNPPDHLVPGVDVGHPVPGQRLVEAVEEGPEKTSYSSHGNEDEKVKPIPQPTLNLAFRALGIKVRVAGVR